VDKVQLLNQIRYSIHYFAPDDSFRNNALLPLSSGSIESRIDCLKDFDESQCCVRLYIYLQDEYNGIDLQKCLMKVSYWTFKDYKMVEIPQSRWDNACQRISQSRTKERLPEQVNCALDDYPRLRERALILLLKMTGKTYEEIADFISLLGTACSILVCAWRPR